MKERKVLRPKKHVLVHLKSDARQGRKAKHHLLIFKVPNGYGIWPKSIRCPLPSWTPTHGSPKKWAWIGPDSLASNDKKWLLENKIGLLVPRFFWDIMYGFLPEKIKLGFFTVKALRTHK